MSDVGTLDVSDWKRRAEAILRERGMSLADLPDVPDGETADDRERRKREQAANRASRWRARLPAMYAEAGLADLDLEQHRPAVVAWLNDLNGATLILAGTVGSGKTHAAYAVGNAAVARGFHVEAVTVHDLLHALRPEGDRTLTHAVRTCDLLVLDDLGATKASAFAQEALTALLDARLSARLRQVVTSNATAQDVLDAYGGRFADRLNYRATVLPFRGESRRKGGW